MRRHKRNGNLAGVMDQVKPYAHRAQKRALKAQRKAQKKAGPVVEHAWDRVAPAVETAKERITPAVETAKERLGPAVEDAREKVAAAALSAMIASEPFRQEAMKRGTAAWLALRGDLRPPEPKRNRHWLRNILLLGGIGGSAYVAYRILRTGSASEWLPKQANVPLTGDAEPETQQPGRTETPKPATSATAKHKNDETTGQHDAKQPAASGSTANRSTRTDSGQRSSEPPKN